MRSVALTQYGCIPISWTTHPPALTLTACGHIALPSEFRIIRMPKTIKKRSAFSLCEYLCKHMDIWFVATPGQFLWTHLCWTNQDPSIGAAEPSLGLWWMSAAHQLPNLTSPLHQWNFSYYSLNANYSNYSSYCLKLTIVSRATIASNQL